MNMELDRVPSLYKKLQDLYLRAESMMVKKEGAAALRELLLEINIVYEELFKIIADLPADEIVVGTDWSKANLQKSKFEFDDRAREWMSVVENPMTLLGKKRSLDYESSIRTSNSIRSERRRSAIKTTFGCCCSSS